LLPACIADCPCLTPPAARQANRPDAAVQAPLSTPAPPSHKRIVKQETGTTELVQWIRTKMQRSMQAGGLPRRKMPHGAPRSQAMRPNKAWLGQPRPRRTVSCYTFTPTEPPGSKPDPHRKLCSHWKDIGPNALVAGPRGHRTCAPLHTRHTKNGLPAQKSPISTHKTHKHGDPSRRAPVTHRRSGANAHRQRGCGVRENRWRRPDTLRSTDTLKHCSVAHAGGGSPRRRSRACHA